MPFVPQEYSRDAEAEELEEDATTTPPCDPSKPSAGAFKSNADTFKRRA